MTQKRLAELERMAEMAGLVVLSKGLNSKGRFEVCAEAPNGSVEKFSLSTHSGDFRGELNEKGRMKRFARANPAPKPTEPPAQAVGKVQGLVNPILRPRATPSLSVVAARVGASALAAPPPEPFIPAPASTPTMNKTPEAANDKQSRNALSHDEVIELNDWVRGGDPTPYRLIADMARAATASLGFEVTVPNLESALKRNKVTHFDRKPPTLETTHELSVAVAGMLAHLSQTLGERIPEQFASVFEAHGVAVPAPTQRKAA